ncbi:MAG: hypothetical protein V9G63_02795 [Candidatus Competibacter sp.]|nr:hypothetical protein [Candidatus Competibacteraceae bacterium]
MKKAALERFFSISSGVACQKDPLLSGRRPISLAGFSVTHQAIEHEQEAFLIY